jgi:hypothetical protein
MTREFSALEAGELPDLLLHPSTEENDIPYY